jgi:hypothetical protein
MKYLTGLHALNLKCELLTCGDWHTSALKWENLTVADTEKSVFGMYGIELNRTIPFTEIPQVMNVANHIRALLDLVDGGKFAVAQGMNKDFICNENYDGEVFDKVLMLRNNQNWNEIDRFMEREYRLKWLKYRKGNRI